MVGDGLNHRLNGSGDRHRTAEVLLKRVFHGSNRGFRGFHVLGRTIAAEKLQRHFDGHLVDCSQFFWCRYLEATGEYPVVVARAQIGLFVLIFPAHHDRVNGGKRSHGSYLAGKQTTGLSFSHRCTCALSGRCTVQHVHTLHVCVEERDSGSQRGHCGTCAAASEVDELTSPGLRNQGVLRFLHGLVIDCGTHR